MYKLMTGKTKVDYKQFFKLAPVRQGDGNTRESTGYLNVEEPPKPSGDIRKYFFSHRCPRVWNCLPDCVKMASTVNSFKAAYDEFKTGSRHLS